MQKVVFFDVLEKEWVAMEEKTAQVMGGVGRQQGVLCCAEVLLHLFPHKKVRKMTNLFKKMHTKYL